MEYRNDRPGIAPWVWVLIVLAAIILIFVIWWAVAAQGPEQVVVVPGGEEEQPVQPPPQQPSAQQPEEQPQVIERERPVNIYIEREGREPNVVVVPRDEQQPRAEERMRQVDLPGEFRYQGRTWEPSDQAVSGDEVSLRDTGASVDGNVVYARQDAERPYDELYLETEPGSGIYIKYEPTGSSSQ